VDLSLEKRPVFAVKTIGARHQESDLLAEDGSVARCDVGASDKSKHCDYG
jgi:hypothetical protein